MADTTRSSKPPAKGGKKSGQIMGLDRNTFFMVGAAVVVLGFFYFYMKSKQQPQGQGQGGAKNARKANNSPTGLQREHIVIWHAGHSGHKHTPAGG